MIDFFIFFNYSYSMTLKNKAFSTIEMLMTFAIAALLFLIGARFYNEQKKDNDIRMTQAEMTEALKFVQMAKQMDGGYHQFLYQMGYTPKGKIIAIIGTGAGNTSPCCSDYPALGDLTCTKTIGAVVNTYKISGGQTCGEGFICCDTSDSSCPGPDNCQFGKCPPGKTCACKGEQAVESYSYYNCKNDSLNNATNNIEICNHYSSLTPPDPDLKCETSSAPAAFPTFTKCTPNPTGWCNCDQFMIGAKSNFFKHEITLNHKNNLCIQE